MNIALEIGESEIQRVQELQATLVHMNAEWSQKSIDEFVCFAFFHGLAALEAGCAIMKNEGYQSGRLH